MTLDGLDTHTVYTPAVGNLGCQLFNEQFLFLTGGTLSDLLAVSSSDILSFAEHWQNLTLDRYMGDGGIYRFRRYGEFESAPKAGRRQLAHGPYEQPKYINALNGGMDRLFDPLEPQFVSHMVLARLLDWLTALYDQCEGVAQHWNIRLHPYRIISNCEVNGNPTPEGLHRDGVDYIVSMLIQRRNVTGGKTTITDNVGKVLWQKSLQQPLDIMVGRDSHIMHTVSPITQLDAHREAYRDVLVVAFTKIPN